MTETLNELSDRELMEELGRFYWAMPKGETRTAFRLTVAEVTRRSALAGIARQPDDNLRATFTNEVIRAIGALARQQNVCREQAGQAVFVTGMEAAREYIVEHVQLAVAAAGIASPSLQEQALREILDEHSYKTEDIVASFRAMAKHKSNLQITCQRAGIAVGLDGLPLPPPSAKG